MKDSKEMHRKQKTQSRGCPQEARVELGDNAGVLSISTASERGRGVEDECTGRLLGEILDRENLNLAFKRVKSNKGSHICPADKSLNKRTVGCMKRAEAIENTTEVMLKLLDSAKGIPAKYLLLDSWFAFPKTIANVIKRRIDVICMLKISTKIHYFYEGEWMNLKSIYSKINHSAKGNIIGSVVAGIRESRKCTETIPVKIVFEKDRHS